jgi:hypothetical protein
MGNKKKEEATSKSTSGKDGPSIWQHLSLDVGSPSGTTRAEALRRTFSKRVTIAGDFKTCDNGGPAGGRTVPPARALPFGGTHIPPV